jgi:alpha-beta hydrolase superfamily lysophospholipase
MRGADLSGVLRILLIFGLAYGLLIAVAFLLQRKMLYYPDRSPPTATMLAMVELRTWPANGDMRGLLGVETPQPAAGTVLVWHGNAGAAWQRGYYVDALHALGYRVLLAEYPGYGGRPGEPSEAALVADAQETLRRAYAEFGAPIYLWGESLGAGVVAAVAAQPSAPVAGLVLLTPWDSLPDLAQRLYPFLPMRWLLRDRYDSVRNLQSVTVPIAVVIAEQDEIIPLAHSQRLYDSLAAPKRRWVLPGAGHNTWPAEAHHAWWGEVMAFVTGNQPG